jgi:6-methylsalicylate decarboxylase
MPQPLLDYPAETSRAAQHMIVTGTKRKYPHCKVILSHAGGTLPFLIHRCSYMGPGRFPDKGMTEAQIEEDFKSFYFDLALSGAKNVLDVLQDLVPHDHLLFWSDTPYASLRSVKRMTTSLGEASLRRSRRGRFIAKIAWNFFRG